MLYIAIKENTMQGKAFAEFVKTLPFVDIVEKESTAKMSKKEFLDDFKQSMKEVKLMQEGKIKKKSLKQMLNGK